MGAAGLDPLTTMADRTREKSILETAMANANLLIEVRDARLPLLSAASPLPRRFLQKRRLLVLNKTDRADPEETDRWAAYLSRQGESVVVASALSPGKALSRLKHALETRGVETRGRALSRAAVIGLPNVGKSTLLNALVGSARARTGDRPGITKGIQWVRLAANTYLLDSPGNIPLADGIEKRQPNDAFKLALCRILPEGRLEALDTALDFAAWLRERPRVAARLPLAYRPLADPGIDPRSALQALARSAAVLTRGGVPDMGRAAARFMVDFASGKLGRFTLEAVPPPQPAFETAGTRES